MRLLHSGAGLLACSVLALAAGPSFAPYVAIKPVLDAQRTHLPAGFHNASASEWITWSRQRDREIRARLQQGELDSLAHLLLFGTSFTSQPRIPIEGIAQASKSGILRARVDDLISGLRNPGTNERLILMQQLLRSQGIDPEGNDAGGFLYRNLLHELQERKTLAERAAAHRISGLDRASLFSDRGLSLDTGIIPVFTIEQTLRDLNQRGLLRDGQVTRAAIIGPGLDLIDKNEESAFDYYPPQTLQPFALYDSFLRLNIARPGALSVSIFDISPRVIDHIQRARERARKNIGYVIQLPRDIGRPWPAELIDYWKSLGESVGAAVEPIKPPSIFAGLETRAVEIRPDVVLACEPADLNIILERLNLVPAERFDLIVATNIFVYYDAFEQSLALENAGAMLKAGGLLLTNDHLPEVPGGSMRLAGTTVVPFDTGAVTARQAIAWYQKK